ncbi:MAG: penicillin acylase family protein, partial [Myxococcota bacterium]
AYYYSLGQWGSGYAIGTTIGQAQPPNADGEGNLVPSVPAPPVDILDEVIEPPIGSNGWAIGRDESTTSGGLLLSNTHFPAEGERQWHEFHLTIPGELNVYGVGLVGLPIPAMGFNEHLGWTHTVSNTERFTPYLLDPTGADATSYVVDERSVAMDAATYTIDVRDGSSTRQLERTLYRSQWGPIWNAPVVGWNGVGVMSYRDVNYKNDGLMWTFDLMNRATNIEEFKAAHRDHQGIPWVHTMMADKDGNAFYTDSAAAPLISDEVWANYDAFRQTNFVAGQFQGFGLTVFDGTSSGFEWSDDDRAARPGTVPFDDSPQLTRADHVSNANQNHWMANPAEPLEGLPRIYGATGTARTTRTRMNNFYLQGLGDDPERGEDGKWSLEELEAAAMSFRLSTAELLLDDVVDRCDGAGTVNVTYNGTPTDVDVDPACAVLAAWDGRGRTDSVGAHVWRELMGSGPISPDDLFDAGVLFANGFDASDPIGTPNGLAAAPAEGDDPVLQGLAIATLNLQRAGVALDAKLGDIQFRKKGAATYAVPGGQYFEGYIGIATWSGGGNTTLIPRTTRAAVVNSTTDLTEEGYVVTNGNSFMMALQFGDDGPKARGVMVYSQSEDVDSPYFADQTALYAENEMRDILFTEAEIAADPGLVSTSISYP